ncbi:MAG: cupredoxin domain-containing protein [Minisyncoccota bacterium]
MRNIIIILVIAIVAFFVWKFIPRSETAIYSPNIITETTQTPEASDQATPAVTNTVTYDGTTFTPSTLTIKQGDSITFINNSTGGMSVASDPHPSHSIYPEFDQYKTSSKGQKTFTFVFDKVGTWGFHNHLNSSAVGSVTVTAK